MCHWPDEISSGRVAPGRSSEQNVAKAYVNFVNAPNKLEASLPSGATAGVAAPPPTNSKCRGKPDPRFGIPACLFWPRLLLQCIWSPARRQCMQGLLVNRRQARERFRRSLQIGIHVVSQSLGSELELAPLIDRCCGHPVVAKVGDKTRGHWPSGHGHFAGNPARSLIRFA